MMWHLSNKQLARLEHGHVLRLALPVPLDGDGDDDDLAWARSVLALPPEQVIAALRRTIIVVPRPGSGGMEGVYGSVWREQHNTGCPPAAPPLTVSVIVVEVAGRRRLAPLPIQWAGRWVAH